MELIVLAKALYFWKSEEGFYPAGKWTLVTLMGQNDQWCRGNDVMWRLVSAWEGTWIHASAMNNLRIHSQHKDIQKHIFRISMLDNQNWRRNYSYREVKVGFGIWCQELLRKMPPRHSRFVSNSYTSIFLLWGTAEMLMIQLCIMVLLLHTECEKGECLEGGTEIRK